MSLKYFILENLQNIHKCHSSIIYEWKQEQKEDSYLLVVCYCATLKRRLLGLVLQAFNPSTSQTQQNSCEFKPRPFYKVIFRTPRDTHSELDSKKKKTHNK